MLKDNDIVIIGGARTPMSHFGGTLKDYASYELGQFAIDGVFAKTKIAKNEIDEVMGGSTRQAGAGLNPVRTAVRLAGLRAEVPAVTINNACPSSMKALIYTVQNIMLGVIKTGLVVGYGKYGVTFLT